MLICIKMTYAANVEAIGHRNDELFYLTGDKDFYVMVRVTVLLISLKVR